MATRPNQMGVVVSCDVDDETMTSQDIQQQVVALLSHFEWNALYYSANRNKIEACNADIEKVDYPWDIVVLVSDDMIPQVRGYDEIIRNSMTPDLDRILWFNDGWQGQKLNTLSIYGHAMYNRLGSMYCPEYKSFYCDTELTDLCTSELKDKTTYSPTCIIRHVHPALGYAVANDALYARNNRYFEEDMRTYISRKPYAFDLSILIPTLVERRLQCERLKATLREKFARLCPGLRLEILEALDNRELSVGLKRRNLLAAANGKYSAFIDDDDDVTDAYFEDFATCFTSKHDVMQLRGQMGDHTFIHSLVYPVNGVMYKDGMFVRPPNHLNPMLADIAKMIRFDDAVRGEDLKWTIDLARSGLLKSETPTCRVHYIYTLGNRTIPANAIEYQKTHTYDEMLNLLFARPEPKKVGLRLSSRGFVSK